MEVSMTVERRFNIDPEAGAVVISGAASGIGRATVDLLVQHGVPVVAFDANREVERLWAGTSGVRAVLGNTAVESDVVNAFNVADADFSKVQGAVAAAGIARSGTVVDTPLETWKQVIEVNLSGVFLWAKEAVRRFAEQGSGSFVGVASQVGMVGYPTNAAYCSAKAAVINLMKCITVDFASQGVRANAICPGPIDTPMTQVGFDQSGEDYGTVLQRVPANRMGGSDEIAAAIGFLLSKDAEYMNGSALVVDGGYTAQ